MSDASNTFNAVFCRWNGSQAYAPHGDYCGRIFSRASFAGVATVETLFTSPTAVPRHRHEFPHLLLVIRGAFEVAVEGRRTELSTGDAIFHEPAQIHSGQVWSSGARGFTVELTAYPNLTRAIKGCAVYERRTNISALLAQLYRETQTEDLGREFAVEGLQLQVVAALMRQSAVRAAQPPRWLECAKQFLHDTPCERHTMAELSVVLGIDQKEIVSGFRKFLHATPAEYQRTLRIALARRALAETTCSIAQIAAETGFCDQAYFSNQFKRVLNCTPAQYRRLFRSPRLDHSPYAEPGPAPSRHIKAHDSGSVK